MMRGRLQVQQGFARDSRAEGVSGRDDDRRGSKGRANDARLMAARPVFGGEMYG
jgi:hypothetical protein